MIDIKRIRQDWEGAAASLEKRGVKKSEVENLYKLDTDWREQTRQAEELRGKLNEANNRMAGADKAEKTEAIVELRKISAQLAETEVRAREIGHSRATSWRSLPNFLAADVPVGGNEDFESIKTEAHDSPLRKGPSYLNFCGSLIDTERAVKISGSRFAILKGDLVRLELALVMFGMDELGGVGFTPVMGPQLIKAEAMDGMGYLDSHADEVYKTQDDLYLIGTSEQAMGAMHMDEIISREELPRRYVSFSSCFRREAGSHGKDVKGMMRLHQFEKVEMFSFCAPDQSEEEHDFIVHQQVSLMHKLELPYRIIKLASRDLGAPAAKTYDIETWMPGEGKWRETHSASNTTDYQARRLNIRIKDEAGKIQKAHMLNGTAFALQRILIAILENHYDPEGFVRVPTVLQKYTGFEKMVVKGK